jgi:glycosyltransferase involved in cell wall biosynthesis
VRIAFVSQPWASALPPSESVAIWTNAVARRLASRHDVAVLARARESDRHEGVVYDGIEAERDWRVMKLLRPTDRLWPRRLPLFASPLYHPLYWREVARRANRFDVVHLHNFSQPARALRAAGARVVLHMHCDWLTQVDPRLVRRRLAAVDLVLTCSDYLTSRGRSALPGTRWETVHNGVQPGPDARPDGRTILFVGRVSPDKGVHVLVEAFRLLCERRDDPRLELIGDEALPPLSMQVRLDEEPRVRRLARFYRSGAYLEPLLAELPPGIADRVTHRPWIAQEEVLAAYRRAAVVVLPSVWNEPFGMPAAEAQAAGRPVVASNVGGLPEVVVDGQTGLLVPPDDPSALAAAIGRVLDDPALARRLGEAGRRQARERFSWDAVARRVEALYGEL